MFAPSTPLAFNGELQSSRSVYQTGRRCPRDNPQLKPNTHHNTVCQTICSQSNGLNGFQNVYFYPLLVVVGMRRASNLVTGLDKRQNNIVRERVSPLCINPDDHVWFCEGEPTLVKRVHSQCHSSLLTVCSIKSIAVEVGRSTTTSHCWRTGDAILWQPLMSAGCCHYWAVWGDGVGEGRSGS